MSRIVQFCCLLVIALGLLPANSVWAARPCKSLLPDTTKGFVSIPDYDDLKSKWNETQLGKLIADPIMKPFIDDLQEQLKDRFDETRVRLSISFADLDAIYGGEIGIAKVQPGGDKLQHALVLLVDVTGHLDQANQLMARVTSDLIRDGAKRSTKVVGGTEIVSFVLPKKAGEKVAPESHYFIHEEQLVATDHLATATSILGRFHGDAKDALETVPAYSVSMQRCDVASRGAQPQISWFVEPFGYAEVARAEQGGRKRRGTDMLKVLANQGFTAVQGFGGYIFLMHGGDEIQHRTSIYAPPVKQGPEKYELAANMLSFPNQNDLTPQSWVPEDVSSYFTFSWEMQKAFHYSKTLVDEVAGAPVFDDIMDSLKNDPNGPQIDVQNDFVKHLGHRVTFFTDVRLPISPTSERWLLALELTDHAAVTRTLNKAMAADPDAKKHVIGNQIIWEIVEKAEEEAVDTLEISGPGGFGDLPAEEMEEEEKPLLPNSALTVAHGQLFVASHVDFIVEVLEKAKDEKSLAKARQYKMVSAAVANISAKVNSFHYFAKTEEAYHPTYELIRQGKMPESKTLFGILLNRLLAPEEEGVMRKQEINGAKLPPFEKVKHYFGPAGLVVSSLPDGWFVSGCLLTRPDDAGAVPGEESAAGPLVSKEGPELR